MKRKEQLVENTWDLTTLYENEELWEKDFEKAKELCNELTSFKGKLLTSAKILYDYYTKDNELSLVLNKVYCYVARKRDEDSSVSKYQEMLLKAYDLYSKISEELSFVGPELKTLNKEKLDEFYEEEPRLKEFDRCFELLFRSNEHILTEELEKVQAMVSNFGSASSDIYDAIVDTDLKFKDIEVNGENVEITEPLYGKLIRDPNREVRRQIFESILSSYKSFENTFASCLYNNTKYYDFSTKLNNYKSPLDASLSDEGIPEEVYTNLIETVHKNLDKLHRYTAIKKKVLGLDEIHFYDLYVPIVESISKEMTFEEGKELAIKALNVLGENYIELLKEGFENRWIDIYPNEGKPSGAYATSCYDSHPFVLLNYNNTLDDVSTLVHEMGHAIHFYKSNKNQPVHMAGHSIFTAEVASTCNEALLSRYLLENTTSKKEKLYLIHDFLESFRCTLYRQVMFAEFELTIHTMVSNGEPLTAEKINEIYKKLYEVYYGNDFIIDDLLHVEWARIPHFYNPFYVYQYATGYSAAIALSEKILNGTYEDKDNYIKFLESGNSKDPIDILKIAGVDMSKAESIQEALDFFGKLLDEFEEIYDSLD